MYNEPRDMACSEIKTSEVEQQLSSLELEEKRLDGIIGNLETRLSSILRVIPSGSERVETDGKELTPLAGQIRHLTTNIMGFSGRIEGILNRLEL